jgi:hypothetical protein
VGSKVPPAEYPALLYDPIVGEYKSEKGKELERKQGRKVEKFQKRLVHTKRLVSDFCFRASFKRSAQVSDNRKWFEKVRRRFPTRHIVDIVPDVLT